MLTLLKNLKYLLGANTANNPANTSRVAANEDGSVLERMEQVQEAVNNGTGTALGTNRSLVDELLGASLNYNRTKSGVISIGWTATAWKTAAVHKILDVTGVVRIRLAIYTGVNMSPAAATIKFGTSTRDLIAATTVTGLDAGEFFISSTLASNVKTLLGSNLIDIITSEDVGFTVANTTMTSGTMSVYYWWEPLSSTGDVDAASGGTFGS